MNTRHNDWIDKDLTKEDLFIYSYAGKEYKNIKEIFLGYYLPWNPHEIALKSQKFGRNNLKKSLTGIHNFSEDDDDFIVPVAEWLKWHKFGITRTWDNLAIDIRLGRLSREKAIENINKIGYQKPLSAISKFCDYLKITTQEFEKICDSFRNKQIWYIDNGYWKIKNFLIRSWEWNEKPQL